MSPEAQRIAIAEACGWKIDPDLEDGELMGTSPKGYWDMLPDYLHDLNAMHEAEETLGSYIPNFMRYLFILKDISPWCGVRATAAQRAEAFLRTIGKWEGGK